MNYLLALLTTGIGATALIDLCALGRRRLFGIPLPDYGLVGRWIAYLPRGQLVHRPIAASAPIAGERAVGWIAHYLIGIGFAAALPLCVGIDLLAHPRLLPALTVGLVSVLAPFLFMQPAMGAGIAAARAARPWRARLQSLTTHAVFGLGLYLAGWIAGQLFFN